MATIAYKYMMEIISKDTKTTNKKTKCLLKLSILFLYLDLYNNTKIIKVMGNIKKVYKANHPISLIIS